jgi:hypothetical protein
VLKASATGVVEQAGAAMSEERWYFCLVHQRVEPEDGCAHSERLGPYATREQAERALQTAAERNEAWDNDPRWKDD